MGSSRTSAAYALIRFDSVTILVFSIPGTVLYCFDPALVEEPSALLEARKEDLKILLKIVQR